MFPPPLASAPQSWYRGCDLESLGEESYDPNYTAVCPSGFSQNSGWAPPNPILTMPTLAPNSAAYTNVASAILNGGPDGMPVAANAASAQPDQSLGPASMTNAVPSIIPPYWNSPPPPPPSLAQQLGNWACQNPALAAASIGVVFLLFSKGGKA